MTGGWGIAVASGQCQMTVLTGSSEFLLVIERSRDTNLLIIVLRVFAKRMYRNE